MTTKPTPLAFANPNRRWQALLLALLLLTAGVCLSSDHKPASGFSYTEHIENEGSRSAGARGELRYQGHPVPPGIGQIKTPIGSYHHLTSALLWRPQGWFPTEDFPVGSTTDRITADMLQAGRYQGAHRAGTPENWCYLPLEDAWIDPKQLLLPANPSNRLPR